MTTGTCSCERGRRTRTECKWLTGLSETYLKTCRNETKKNTSVRQRSVAALTPLVFDWAFLKPVNLWYQDNKDVITTDQWSRKGKAAWGWMDGWMDERTDIRTDYMTAGQTGQCYIPQTSKNHWKQRKPYPNPWEMC